MVRYQCLENGFDGWERRTGLKIQATLRPQFKQKMLRSMMGCFEMKEYFSGKLLKYTLKADYKVLKIRISRILVMLSERSLGSQYHYHHCELKKLNKNDLFHSTKSMIFSIGPIMGLEQPSSSRLYLYLVSLGSRNSRIQNRKFILGWAEVQWR